MYRLLTKLNAQLRHRGVGIQTGFVSKIERVFESIKRWFGRLEARYVEMAKTHGQHVLAAIAYNLYRRPGKSCPRHEENGAKKL